MPAAAACSPEKTAPSDEPLYSYTIVTVPADKTLTWLHDRMPAILRTPEEAAAWLDAEAVSADEVRPARCSGRGRRNVAARLSFFFSCLRRHFAALLSGNTAAAPL